MVNCDNQINRAKNDSWNCHYSEFYNTQKQAKNMSQGLNNMAVDTLKDGDKQSWINLYLYLRNLFLILI